jgi:hypothetical protein
VRSQCQTERSPLPTTNLQPGPLSHLTLAPLFIFSAGYAQTVEFAHHAAPKSALGRWLQAGGLVT